MELVLVCFGAWIMALTLGVFALFLKLVKQHALSDLAIKAYEHASDCHVRIGALEKSTHSIHPVPVNNEMSEKLEEQLAKLTGVTKEDFDTDLLRAGFNTTDAEDLV